MNIAIVGGGVIGMSIATKLTRYGKVVVIERNAYLGIETSARNSQVIHAGVYYPEKSKKARFCTSGNALLYQFCADFDVPVHQCGKLIVACSAQDEQALQAIQHQADRNGVYLEMMDKAQATRLEPELQCTKALFSPTSGVLDVADYMDKLQYVFENDGGSIAYHTEITKGYSKGKYIILTTSDGDEIPFDFVINAAGHGAIPLANTFPNRTQQYTIPKLFAKGNYFKLQGPSPFSHLIYPIPDSTHGLGIHSTLDIAGDTIFGPNVEWTPSRTNYNVSSKLDQTFKSAISSYYPNIIHRNIHPHFAGIRPKYHSDFVIQDNSHHGVQNLVHLLGIESPGLTSSLSIAHYIESTYF